MKHTTKCLFTVHSVQPRHHYIYNRETGKHEDKGLVDPPRYDVVAMPFFSPDENHPNRKFFESTPAGQLQVYNTINFAPKIGSEVEILLTWDDGLD